MSTNEKIALVLLGLVVVIVLTILTTGCVPVEARAWINAKTSNEEARAAAEWARTAQVQAETAAAAVEAPVREQARTVAAVATLAVGVLTLAGLGSALVTWAWMRARLVFTDKAGLYPAVIGTARATNLNESGAQHARIVPHRAPVHVLPPPESNPMLVIPQPIEIDAQRLAHIERLLLEAPTSTSSAEAARSMDYDRTD